jgi:hypothetical protein
VADTERRYVPADRWCLGVGILPPLALAGLVWLVARPDNGFVVLGLGVIAAVLGMVIAGLCARARERARLRTDPEAHRAGKRPAAGAPDPFRGMEKDERAATPRREGDDRHA